MNQLLEKVKNLREKQKTMIDITCHEVEWDVDQTLIGEPINDKTITKLSTDVDNRLKEYSAIYDTNAATQENKFASAINANPVTRREDVKINSCKNLTFEMDEQEFDERDEEEQVTCSQLNTQVTNILESLTVENDFQRQYPFNELYRLPVGTSAPDEEDLVEADNTRFHPDFERGQVVMRLPIFQSDEEKKTRDSIMVSHAADRELHISNNLESLSRRWSGYYPEKAVCDKTSYVTSYTVQVISGIAKIQARIITAPAKASIDDELWFQYCTGHENNDSETSVRRSIRNLIKSNLCILSKTRNIQLQDVKPSEIVALETLREFVTEDEFKHYLRYGFLNVKGASGRIYQVFRSRRHTNVWEDGHKIEEVCVQIKDDNVPISDQVIALKTMIETSEDLFKKYGNVYKMKVA
jgi:hypothetical protein